MTNTTKSSLNEIFDFIVESVDSLMNCEEYGETIEINHNYKYMIIEKDGIKYKINILIE